MKQDDSLRIGRCYYCLEQYKENLCHYKVKVLDGGSHSLKLIALLEINDCYYRLKRYEKALCHYYKAFQGGDHFLIIEALWEMGHCYYRLKQYKKALDYFQKSFDEGISHLGGLDSKVEALRMIGWIHTKLGQYSKVLEVYNIFLGRESFPEPTPSWDTELQYFGGLVYGGLGHHKKAIELLERASKRWDDTVDTQLLKLHIKWEISCGYYKLNQYDRALNWAQEALDGFVVAKGPDHCSNLDLEELIANIYHAWGQYEKGLDWLQKLEVQRETIFGVEHKRTLLVKRRCERLQQEFSMNAGSD